MTLNYISPEYADRTIRMTLEDAQDLQDLIADSTLYLRGMIECAGLQDKCIGPPTTQLLCAKNSWLQGLINEAKSPSGG